MGFRYLRKLLKFGNCVLLRKKEVFYLQDKKNNHFLPIEGRQGREENPIGFHWQGAAVRGKEIILVPEGGET